MICRGTYGFPALLLSLTLTACTGASAYVPMAQSNFAIPNARLDPKGHVKATVTRSYLVPFQTPDIPSAAMQREAYLKALQDTGGDLIIDGDFTVKTTMVPLLFLMLITAEGTVEGTAVKMAEIGSLQLH